MQADHWTFARSSRNHGNHLRNDDPRFVLLFISPYNAFTGNGNETYPITAIGGFYITGYGRTSGNGPVSFHRRGSRLTGSRSGGRSGKHASTGNDRSNSGRSRGATSSSPSISAHLAAAPESSVNRPRRVRALPVLIE